jgi:hypothetical protein
MDGGLVGEGDNDKMMKMKKILLTSSFLFYNAILLQSAFNEFPCRVIIIVVDISS